MNREVHVRFWESLGVRFPWATQLREMRACDGPAEALLLLVPSSPSFPLRAGNRGAPRVQAAAAPEQTKADPADCGGPTN